jgi:hypothetical protein
MNFVTDGGDNLCRTWLIAHDQVSVPVDPQTRTALPNLAP